jgi:hypothetical protein
MIRIILLLQILMELVVRARRRRLLLVIRSQSAGRLAEHARPHDKKTALRASSMNFFSRVPPTLLRSRPRSVEGGIR